MPEDSVTPEPDQPTPIVPAELARNLPTRLHRPAHELLSLSSADRAKVFKAFKKTPAINLEVEQQQGTIVRHSILEASMWQGPLPPPDHLEKFNAIVPGAASRLIAMVEKQQEHRMGLENLAVRSQLSQSGRGQIFGLCIGFGGMFLSAYLGYLGATTAAASVGAVTLGGLAVAFITGKHQEAKSRARKPQPTRAQKGES